MSNTDELTEKLKEPEDYQTKPVMNLILERINEIGDELKAFRQETNVRLDALETGVKSLREDFDAFRKETTENFHRVDKKFEIVHLDIQQLRPDFRLIEDRVDGLERKAS